MSHDHKVKKQQSWSSSITEFLFLLCVVFLIRTFGFGLYQVPTGSMETTMLVGERFFADKLSYNFRKPRHGEIISMNDPEFKYSKNPAMNLFQHYVWGPSNWTKRVIGLPGDTIKGVIEDGKPVVYRNGEKLHESYINTYPLIRSFKQDPAVLMQQIQQEIQQNTRGYKVNQDAVDLYVAQRLAYETCPRSYDPTVAYDQQPFYRIYKNRVIRDEDGNPELTIPGEPLMPKNGKLTPDETRNNWNGSDVFYIKLGQDEYWGMGDNRLGSHDSRFFGPIKEREIHGRILFRIWSMDSDESWWIVDLIKHPIDFWSRIRWSRWFDFVK
ncbi:MAG TPA: signal peptidase I [Candidatus Babeliales bacterium]|jgi:signal peptidase I|nr:signal peptidase I [Candidatus Babeliales bacterium]